MSPIRKLVLSIGALFGLMYGGVSHAVDVAQRPLQGAAMIYPNLIFGIDESGSMDWEIMVRTSNGVLWWDTTNRTGWNASGTPLQGKAAAEESLRTYSYLFPLGYNNGSFDGRLLYYADFSVLPNGGGQYKFTWGNVVPPMPEFAAMRSSVFNPLYYDPGKDYTPWRARYDSTAASPDFLKTYPDASITAAKSHPESSGATLSLTSNIALNNNEGTFYTLYEGMTVPVGASWRSVSSGNTGGWSGAISSPVTVPAGATYHVAMPYYPATYWVKESCTVPASPSLADTCARAPDGGTLKRYEIRSTVSSYPSGRTYAQEIQNFANWFTYYRKRQNMLAASMGEVLDGLTGINVGMVKFNDRKPVVMYDTSDVDNAKNGRRILETIYTHVPDAVGTPTRETLQYIGEQYRTRTSSNADKSLDSIIKYSCQRNNAMVVTDGFAQANDVKSGLSYSNTWFTGNPYQTVYSPSLAELASAYFATNLRSGRTDLKDGKVEPQPSTQTNADTNTNLHMNTYGLMMGAEGTLYTKAGPQFPTGAVAWPEPLAQDITAVDDLWHATINGRGKMFSSTNAEETADLLEEALGDILANGGAQTAVTVSAVNLTTDNSVYLASYNPAGWYGDLKAYPIDSATGAVNTTGTETWSAADQLDAADPTKRILVTYNGTAGVAFSATAMTRPILGLLATDFPTASVTDLVNYFTGDRSKEGTIFRARKHLLGPVINAQPALDPDKKVTYLAANDGFLHAIDLTNGKELWAYAPQRVLKQIGPSAKKSWAFRTMLDGSPTLSRVGTAKMLIGGLGTAGTGFYAIDVDDPTSALTAAQRALKVKWEFADTNLMGLSMGRPQVVRIKGGSTQVVLLTSGYNTPTTGDGRGRIFVLNPSTGAYATGFTSETFKTGEGVGTGGVGQAGLAQLTPFFEADGTVQYVYGGDLLGNLWRFDLVNKTLLKMVTFVDGSGKRQPMMAAPGLANYSGKRVVLVGTGKILGQSDFLTDAAISSNTDPQGFYAIYDDGTTMAQPRTTLRKRTFTKTSANGGTNRVLDTATAGNTTVVDWTVNRGWYVDLLESERANTRPGLIDGTVVFTTNTPNLDSCNARAFVYRLGFKEGNEVVAGETGLLVGANDYVSNPVIVRLNDRRTARVLVQTGNEVVGVSVPPLTADTARKNAWRQVMAN